tara:strand:+ start:5030 stop:5788 length:759 start_codon:yes stop_codon:yes gene_type:complete
MEKQELNDNGEVPPCDFLRFPGIPYILGVQKPEKANSDSDPYGLFVGVSVDGKQEFNGMIITPPKQSDIDANISNMDEEVLKYSGAGITFDKEGNLNQANSRICHIKNCIVGVGNEQKYIYLVHFDKNSGTYKKLWTLPGNIFSLLYLDKIPYNYSFMVNDESQCVICKIQLPTFIHDEPTIVGTNSLNLTDGTTFTCMKSESQKDTLEKSYFRNSRGESIYFKDLKMEPTEDKKNINIKKDDELIGTCQGF